MSTSNCPECGTTLTEGNKCPHCKVLKIDFKFVSCCSPLPKPDTNIINTKVGLSELISSVQVLGGNNDKKC